jgi:hypothetical protein
MEKREKMVSENITDPFKGHKITVTGWTWKIEKDNPF